MTSYRLRMYKRGVWKRRLTVALTGSLIWLGFCLTVAVIFGATR